MMRRWLGLLILWGHALATWALPWPFAERVEVVGRLPQPTAVAVSGGAVLALGADGRLRRWSGEGETVLKPRFPGALGLAADVERIWIADTPRARLVQLDRAGNVRRTWTLGEVCLPPPEEGEPLCRRAEPVAVLAVGPALVWSDRALHALCRLDLASGKVIGCVGGYGNQARQFRYPFQIAVDADGFLTVVDVLGARVQQFHLKGKHVGQWGGGGLGEGDLYRPNGVAIDPRRSLGFVSDAYFGTVTLFYHGQPLGWLRDADGQRLRFDTPAALVYHDGALYVAETGADRILRLPLAFTERPVPPRRDPPGWPRRDCLICHLEFAPEGDDYVAHPDTAGQMPVASFRMCYSCHHGPVMDSRTIIHAGAQHPSVYDSEEKRRRYVWPRKDELPKVFPVTPEHQLRCTTCHTPHTGVDKGPALYPRHHNAWLRVPNEDGRLCERCHGSKAEGARTDDPRRRGRNHPLGVHLEAPLFADAPAYPDDPHLQRGYPETLRRAGGMLGPDDELVCQSCHQIHGGAGDELLLLGADKGQLCRQCHRRQFSSSKREARRKGVHPVNVETEEKIVIDGRRLKWVTCTTCHPVHDGELATPMLKKPVSRLCQDCHRRQHATGLDEARRKGVHPVNVNLEKPVTLAGRKIARLDCLTCHAVHRGKPGTPALVVDHRDGSLCQACHADNLPVIGSDHDLRITAKDSRNRFDDVPKEAGVCGGCHTMHRGEGKWPFLYAAVIVGHPERSTPEGDRTPFRRDQLCLNCHQDHPRAIAKKKVIAWFSHPARDIVLRGDRAHMPLLDDKERDADFGAIGCTTCHDPHVWQPGHHDAEAPPLAANRDNLEGDPHSSFLREIHPEKTFCLGCHGLETREKYKYFHDDFVRGIVDYLQ